MLYIVATPLGNLSDLSLRQAKTLASSDIIISEDTRLTGVLLDQIKKIFGFEKNPNQRLISYYKEKELEKLPEIIELLKSGKNVSLVSESGMPLVSDPGYLLVKTTIKQNLPFTVVAGPTAVTTALVYSGFNPNNYMFLGFLPKKPNHLFQLINKLKQIKLIFPEMVFVFYESPKRINKTLKIIDEIVPNAEVCICREMTKKFEEIVRGKSKELCARSYKGELTIVLSM